MNKKVQIEKYVLQAKLGKKEAYLHLRKIYNFLLEQIYSSFNKICPIINKVDIYHDFYIYFWDAITSYSLSDDTSCFSRHLKKTLIKGMQRTLDCKYDLKGDLVVNENIINGLIKKENQSQNRKKVLRAIKCLTPKQKEAVFFYFYLGFTMDKCRDLLGLKGIAFKARRMKGVYRRLGAALTKIKTNTMKPKLKERIYEVNHRKIGDKK